MPEDASLKLNDHEVDAMFNASADGERFPPVLTLTEAADLLRVPVGTLRDWRSRGLLEGTGRRVGKKVRFIRNRLIKKVFNEGLRSD